MGSQNAAAAQFYLIRYSDDEAELPLFDESGLRAGPHVSILIGPNGSGKSRYLAHVADELTYLAQHRHPVEGRRTMAPPTERASLTYRIDGNLCEITREGRVITCKVEGMPRAIEDAPFPTRVAVVAHLPTDRFRFAGNHADDDFYRYLGLRQATNLTTTGALESKVLESLIRGFQDDAFSSRMTDWLALAGFSAEVGLELSVRDPALLFGDKRAFREAAERMTASRVGNARLSSVKERPEWDSELALMRSFFSSLQEAHWAKEKRRWVTSIDLMSVVRSQYELEGWQAGLQTSRRWRALDSASLILRKAGKLLRFSDLSSGEQQIIGTNARLLAEIAPYSLVIVDEPEISLHPAWQMRYVPTLEQALKPFGAVHVLIATHSHFMVSDVETHTASLIVAGAGPRPRFMPFEGDVYGRSPENILYRVFGVATTGNANVEKDVHDALAMLSGVMPLQRHQLATIHERLLRVCGSDNVVLSEIVNEMGSALEAIP